MEKKKIVSSGWGNLNGVSEDEGVSCALGDMNCLAGQEQKDYRLNDMNAVSDNEGVSCALGDMNCIGKL